MDGEEGPRTGRYWPMFIGFPTIRSGAGELHSDSRSHKTPSNGFSESPDRKSRLTQAGVSLSLLAIYQTSLPRQMFKESF